MPGTRSSRVTNVTSSSRSVGQCFVRAVGHASLPPWERPYTRKLSWAYVAPPVSR